MNWSLEGCASERDRPYEQTRLCELRLTSETFKELLPLFLVQSRAGVFYANLQVETVGELLAIVEHTENVVGRRFNVFNGL